MLDHLGKPRVGGADDGWRDHLRTLSRFPNVVCKLSGLSTEAVDAAWSSVVGPYLAHALDVFGPARCMFGSDWPVLTTAGTYHHWVDAILDSLRGFAGSEVEQVMSGNVRMVYHRPGPPADGLRPRR